MQLIDHVSISVKSLSDCVNFYDSIMKALNCEKVYETDNSLSYGVRCTAGNESHSCLAIYASSTANVDNSRHWCFKATSRDMVISFYQVGLENDGGKCNGAPGLRSHYHKNYFGAFLFDPFGNRIESVYHGTTKT